MPEPKPQNTIKRFLQTWLLCTAAVLVAVHIVPGMTYENWLNLLAASLLLGILNAVLRPLLLLLTLPLVVLSLGLFLLLINAALLWVVGQVIRGFVVEGFGAAFWGALVISIVSGVLNKVTGAGRTRVTIRRQATPTRPPDDGNGPVIDV